jgi:hypothetical protein
VLLEVLVFGGEDGVLQKFGNLVIGKQNASLKREGSYGLAIVGVKLGDNDWSPTAAPMPMESNKRNAKARRPNRVPPPIFIVAR